MDAGSWMEAFERASERLVEDWQVKLVTTGLLAEGVCLRWRYLLIW